MIGAQASKQQFDKIIGCIDTGRNEGAQLMTGGDPRHDVDGGFILNRLFLKVTTA